MFKPIFGDSSSSQNFQQSASCGSFSSTSSSFVDVTNLSVSITTTGRRVCIHIVPDGGTTTRGMIGAAGQAFIQALRDSTVVGVSGSTVSYSVPSSSFVFYDSPAAVNYTYKIQGKTLSGDLWSVTNNVVVVYEM